jgi:hypothetical protein
MAQLDIRLASVRRGRRAGMRGSAPLVVAMLHQKSIAEVATECRQMVVTRRRVVEQPHAMGLRASADGRRAAPASDLSTGRRIDVGDAVALLQDREQAGATSVGAQIGIRMPISASRRRRALDRLQPVGQVAGSASGRR